jgi:hypothetical protein
MASVQFGVVIKVDKRKLEQIAKDAPQVDTILGDLASDHVVRTARQLVPVRTGFLKSTIQRVSGEASFVEGIGGGGGATLGLRQAGGSGAISFAQSAGQLGRFRGAAGRFISTQQALKGGGKWTVGAYAPYAAHVEFGTYKMAARPYLVPALESVPWTRFVAIAVRRVGLR